MIPDFLRLEALVYELMKEFDKAKELLKEAILESYDSDFIKFLQEEIERVGEKKRFKAQIHYSISK